MSNSEPRSVVVPSTLPDKFLSVCLKNTQANIETCGILAAKLQGNKFTGKWCVVATKLQGNKFTGEWRVALLRKKAPYYY